MDIDSTRLYHNFLRTHLRLGGWNSKEAIQRLYNLNVGE